MTARPRVQLEDSVADLWRTSDGVGFLRAWTRGEVPQGQHVEHTGNVLVEVPAAGRVLMRWTPGEQLVNLSGTVHGGYLSVVCDEAAGLACSSLGERWIPYLTLDLDVTFLRPGLIGQEHRVEGEVLHTGRARTVAEARVLGPDGRLAATARGSFLPNTRFEERFAPR